MSNRDTLPDVGDGGAAVILAGLIVVALLVVGAFYLSSLLTGANGATLEVPPLPASATRMVTAG
jgi:hypothetical protein